jgi:hypothetical protein
VQGYTVDIQGNQHITNKLVWGACVEKEISGASFSGCNTKSGDLITLAQETNGLAHGDRIRAVLHYDVISNMRLGCGNLRISMNL